MKRTLAWAYRELAIKWNISNIIQNYPATKHETPSGWEIIKMQTAKSIDREAKALLKEAPHEGEEGKNERFS